MTNAMTTAEKLVAQVIFLREAARYFEKRDTGGEDLAHWANVYNANNCNEAANTIEAQATEIASLNTIVASNLETQKIQAERAV